MVDKVVLVSANSLGDNDVTIYPAQEHLAIKTLEVALRTAGYERIAFFPSAPRVLWKPTTEYLSGLATELKTIAGNGDVIVGISTSTDDYHKFEALAALTRKALPEAQIIAGGPHFRRERLIGSNRKQYRDSVEIALCGGLADGVVVGHAGPFVELVSKNGVLDSVDSPGFYRLDHNRVVGYGSGIYPEVNHIPYVIRGGYASINLRDGCLNNCDFCCIDNSVRNISPEKAARSLEMATKEMTVPYIYFWDSNLAEPNRLDFYEEVFGRANPVLEYAIKSVMLDPSLLADMSYFSRLLEFLMKHGFREFQMGRETASEESSQMMGSRYRGKVRSQDQLDRERTGIEEFIRRLVGDRRDIYGYGQKHQVSLSYVLTPTETKETALKTIDDMEHFRRMSTGHVNVDAFFSVLSPYPGTRIREKYVDYIINPEDFFLCAGNCWNEKFGRGVHFLHEASIVYHTTPEGVEQYSLLRQAAEKVYSGSFKEPEKYEGIRFLVPPPTL